MFNHSTFEPNVAWERDIDAQHIAYKSIRDIDVDEELCINYGRLWFFDTDARNDGAAEREDHDYLNKIQIEKS